MAIGDNNSESTQKLQMAKTEVQRWTKKLRIKQNKTKQNQCTSIPPREHS
jgi:hypothetical protein